MLSISIQHPDTYTVDINETEELLNNIYAYLLKIYKSLFYHIYHRSVSVYQNKELLRRIKKLNKTLDSIGLLPTEVEETRLYRRVETLLKSVKYHLVHKYPKVTIIPDINFHWCNDLEYQEEYLV
jgi:hypothetical protein